MAKLVDPNFKVKAMDKEKVETKKRHRLRLRSRLSIRVYSRLR